MSTHPDASPPPRKKRGEPLLVRRAVEPAAASMFGVSLGATRLYVTYAVPITMAVCVAVAFLASSRPDSSDIATAFLLGAAFWFVGFVVQVVSHLAVWGVWSEPCESVTLGLLGVEFPPIHKTPRRLMSLAIVTILPLVLAAGAMTLIGVVWAGESFWLSGFWLDPSNVSLPSLGNSTSDFVWQAGGVLLVIQMLGQTFPLPRTPGRQILLASIAASFRHLDLPRIVFFSRRVLMLISVIVAMISVALLPIELDENVQHWPLLFLLAVLLWVSSRGDDVEFTIWGMVNADASRRGPAHVGWHRRALMSLQSIAGRRRAKRAYLNEHKEAVDASRLDDILTRLHDQGEHSLSSDDRAVLRRVSETLRKTKAKHGTILNDDQEH